MMMQTCVNALLADVQSSEECCSVCCSLPSLLVTDSAIPVMYYCSISKFSFLLIKSRAFVVVVGVSIAFLCIIRRFRA